MRKWLINKRKDRGFTQSEVATKVNIKQPSYCNIESGKTNPAPKTAKKIADVLGFDWTDFYRSEKGA